ncbi:MAG: Glycosidase-related protein [Candidatus Nomurabacteria bacterium GW2011_GWC2_36_9]|nr:MAG: Glycosidase-related protein [Candidatus Nomurabacteria bacterium GW2011_GWC2_36_9]
MYVVKRSEENPIITPNRDHYWEEFATFNMSPVRHGKNIYGLYRAISAVDNIKPQKQTSIIGIGKSKDGVHFEDREPFIKPEEKWEKYGCEDPRVTFFEGKYYIFYTALSSFPFTAESIKVAVAISKDLKKVESRHLVTPFNAKAMTLFPERIDGKIVVIFSFHTDQPPAKVCMAKLDNIEQLWDKTFWGKWIEEIDTHTVDFRRNNYDHLEIGATPIKTKKGWLLIYSHIQNYFPDPERLDRIFGIEALLLDLKDPTKIVGRTGGPILVPEENYEMAGYIDNVIFPTGALVDEDKLSIYYGAADTTVCMAHVSLHDLLKTMDPNKDNDWNFKRYPLNPIIIPKAENKWEAKATFNPAAIYLEGKTHILYRTLSEDNTSFIGYASSKDGFHIDERLEMPVYLPREDFEMKKVPNGNSGCEDPRLTKIGKNIYLCYTAYDSVNPPKVAVSSISEKDFLAHKWNWSKPFLITPPGLDDKDTCIFPEKFKEGYFILHRMNNEGQVNKCIRVIGPRRNNWDSAKVGITAPPIKTKHGWLLLYHGVSKSHFTYRVGALLLDLKDPAIVLARTSDPIFAPEEDYEKFGVVNGVVFPCGMTLRGKELFIYYGGGDKVVGVATIKLSNILDTLVRGAKL